MTVKELSQLYWLNQEIPRDEQRIAELREKAQAAPSPDMSGMPHGSGANTSRTENTPWNWQAAKTYYCTDALSVTDCNSLSGIYRTASRVLSSPIALRTTTAGKR